ncbi:hypothetical protein GCM10010279_32470 [Streptomyces mutabilis]|nr:hypothetical protein GCM10010279_32470 [Streptomyces mutabilis]
MCRVAIMALTCGEGKGCAVFAMNRRPRGDQPQLAGKGESDLPGLTNRAVSGATCGDRNDHNLPWFRKEDTGQSRGHHVAHVTPPQGFPVPIYPTDRWCHSCACAPPLPC